MDSADQNPLKKTGRIGKAIRVEHKTKTTMNTFKFGDYFYNDRLYVNDLPKGG